MSHETLKLLIAQAETASDRTEAVRNAMLQGMPLHEIEQFLDWLDHIRALHEADRVEAIDKLSIER